MECSPNYQEESVIPGCARITCILKLDRKAPVEDDGSDLVKYSREEDMERRVLAVMFALSCKTPLTVFGDSYFRNYTMSLDPRHKPPHHLEVNQIIEVLLDGLMLEFTKIVDEQRKMLRVGFISLSTDFVTDASRRESFGVVLLDLVAQRYAMNDGRNLFMSSETARKVIDQLLSVSSCMICTFDFREYRTN